MLAPILLTYSIVDFLVFELTGNSTRFGYRIFRKTYVASNGFFNDLTSKYLQRKVAKLRAAELSELSELGFGIINEKEDCLSSLRDKGYYCFKTVLPDEYLCNVQGDLNRMKFFYPNSSRLFSDNETLPPRLNRSLGELLNSRHVLSWALSYELVDIAQDYLGSRPYCDLLASWKSYPSKLDNMKSEAAQKFHFDMDRIKFVKFFVYLNDVDSENGPHCYVEGSHRNLPFKIRRDGRFLDREVASVYGSDQIKSLKGLKGSIIAVDTRGLHKGVELISGERDILQVEFSNSLYGHPYPKFSSSVRFSPLEEDLISGLLKKTV